MVPLGERGAYWFACKKSVEDEYLEPEHYQRRRRLIAHSPLEP
jgi:hypothetical protein